LGTGSTEEVLATFSGEGADRHPPTRPVSITPTTRNSCAC
jgi:hypothetical protein